MLTKENGQEQNISCVCDVISLNLDQFTKIAAWE